MPQVETLLAFCTAAFLLSISPGPSNLYIMARSIHQGFNGGAAAALGMAIGSLIYVILTALGLAALFTYAPLAFMALKLCGALYLVYLGVSYLRNATPATTSPSVAENAPLGRIVQQSIIVELTNPKTALFFMAFLPQFVFVEQGPATQQFLILGGMYSLIALLCDLVVAMLGGHFGRIIKNHPKLIHYQDKLSGSLLLGLGTYIGAQEILR